MRNRPLETLEPMAAWLEDPRARLLIQAEGRHLRGAIRHCVGYRMLQIGRWGFRSGVLEIGDMLCRWVVSPAGQGAGDVCFDGENLPVASRCIDAVILPHALELSRSPHRLLREVDRVLCDRGQLLILGFNPLTPWAAWQRLRAPGIGYPGARRLYTPGRVCDWLNLLDFEVVGQTRYGVGFPYLPSDGVDMGRPGLWRLPAVMAQAYLLVARKRVLPVTPLRPPRRTRASMLPAGVPEPTSRVRCPASSEAA